MSKEIGIDLAGVETKKTGFAVLYGIIAKTKVLLSDDQIIDEIISILPSIVSIDAPLSIPLHGKMRVCEKQLVHAVLLLPTLQWVEFYNVDELDKWISTMQRMMGSKVWKKKEAK